MRTSLRLCQSLSIALLMFGLGLAALATPAAAESISRSPSKDPAAYVPGESITITFGGLSTGQGYDLHVRLSNGTEAMAPLYNQTSTTGTFPWTLTIPDDWEGWYYIYVYRNGTSTHWTEPFYVHLFDLVAEANHNVYLPSDTVTVYYYTQRVADQRPLAEGHGRWHVDIRRDNGSGIVTETLSQPFTNTQGSFSFQLPPTTQRDTYTLYVTFNDTTDKHSETWTLDFRVGAFNLDAVLDRSTPAFYQAGESVVVTVYARSQQGGASEPTSGVAITTIIDTLDTAQGSWKNDSNYTVPVLTTSPQGIVSFIVALREGIPDNTTMRVHVTATAGGAAQEDTAEFIIRSSTGPSVDLKLDKTEYRPGDTIGARLWFISSNASLVNGTFYLWTVTNSATGAIMMLDYGTGTSTGSEKSISIPAEFSGQLYIEVYLYEPDNSVDHRSAYANVFASALLLNPTKLAYSPGDTMDVSAALVTDRDCGPGATFTFNVTRAAGGEPVAKGTLGPGAKAVTIRFQIPTQNTDDRYIVNVRASCGGLVAQDSTSVSREKYIALSIDVPDKSYKPGETVTIHYKFVAIGGATMPATTTITVTLYGGAGSLPGGQSVGTRQYEVSAMEGDLTFVVPSTTAPDGDLLVIAYAGSAGSSSATLFTRPSGGASPVSAAANTANWGLIVAVLALFVGVLAIMRRPRPPMGLGESAKAPSSFSDMKPEAPKKAEVIADAPKSDAPASLEPPKAL